MRRDLTLATLFLHTIGANPIQVPFMEDGKAVASLTALQGKLNTSSQVVLDALVEIDGEFQILGPTPMYMGIDGENHFILERSLSTHFLAREKASSATHCSGSFQTPM